MRWQKLARLAIAVFLIVFVGVVIAALRQKKAEPAAEPPPPRKDLDAVLENRGGGDFVATRPDGSEPVRVQWGGSQLTYPDGRATMDGGVTITSERNGRPFTIKGQSAEITQKDRAVARAVIKGDVSLRSGEDMSVTANEATYDEAESVVKLPGAVTFRRGRVRGTGIGATYDQKRDVLWLHEQAHFTVEPDAAGKGAVDASASSIGFARAEHYVRLQGAAHLEGEGRTIDADETVARLSPGDERVRALELRGNSRIRGGGGSGPQAMSARDMDLAYGEDGQTLQHATLVENAVVDLPGAQAAGKRISGKTIDIAMSPDGATVTSLNASENVQLDLPPDGDGPARQIRSATLNAVGAPGAGLQNATFGGGVQFTETREARGTIGAIHRSARAQRLLAQTKPGLGAIEQADFRGHVHFTDGTEVEADAPRGLYNVAQDRIDLSPSQGDPGPTPRVSDGRVTVEARTIEYTLGTRRMKADTNVRSSLLARKRTGADGGRLPALLEEDEPVNVTSNRLEYDGKSGQAIYQGDARLWQGDKTSIRAGRIVVDDKNGNLSANESVATRTFLNDVDPKTKEKKTTETIGKAEMFVYDDAKRLATYTTKAQIEGAKGNVSADKLELFLSKEADELERAEGYGNVRVKESFRTATGKRLTYTAEHDTYEIRGTPVEVIEDKPDGCTSTVGAILTFQRAVDTFHMEGDDIYGMNTRKCHERRR